MTQLRRIAFAYCALSAALACSSPTESGAVAEVSAGAMSSAEVVAKVGAREITLAEVDALIASEIYEARARALEGLINEAVVENAATRAGVEPEQLIDKEIAKLGPVSDEAIASFFAENRDRLPPDQNLEAMTPSIRSYLEQQNKQNVLQGLISAAKVDRRLEPPRVQVAAEGPSIGPADAPITIVEFSDYECPFCGRAEPTIKEVLARYPEKVRLVFRHYPLDSIHPNARGASEAAVCAADQEKFWPFHEKLFENQRALTTADLDRYATEVGLDMDAFRTCRGKSATAERVALDSRAGAEAGVRGTPAFFMNGVLLSGAVPLDEFVEAIEGELARTQPDA